MAYPSSYEIKSDLSVAVTRNGGGFMALKHEFIFKGEGPWSDGRGELLCQDTGSWRVERPVMDLEKCTYCDLCALSCPHT